MPTSVELKNSLAHAQSDVWPLIRKHLDRMDLLPGPCGPVSGNGCYS